MNSPNHDDVLECLSTAVLVLCRDRRVRYLNPAAEALLGSSRSRALGSAVTELLRPEDADPFAGCDAVLTSAPSVTRRGVALHTREGVDVVADLTISQGPVSGHLIVELQPINRLLRLGRDDHALFAQETSRELVRGLAHEIKNPLGGLRGAAQLLERELGDEGLKEYTRVIIDEADRLTTLVDRMLGPNRASPRTTVNVHAVIEHVLRLIDAQARGRLTIGRDYDPSLPPIHGDEDQLVQAMLNIAANAAEALAGRPNPAITVRTRITRQFTIGGCRHRMVVQIDVIDNGPGIAEDMQERMYFPMISGRPDGTGLGLAITQTIIGQHGGTIECDSRPGRTCFSVFLPVSEQEAADG